MQTCHRSGQKKIQDQRNDLVMKKSQNLSKIEQGTCFEPKKTLTTAPYWLFGYRCVLSTYLSINGTLKKTIKKHDM